MNATVLFSFHGVGGTNLIPAFVAPALLGPNPASKEPVLPSVLGAVQFSFGYGDANKNDQNLDDDVKMDIVDSNDDDGDVEMDVVDLTWHTDDDVKMTYNV